VSAKTYPLKHPVEIKTAGDVAERIDTLTLNRLRGEHARRCTASGGMPLLMQLLGCSAGLPPSTMDKIDLEDIIGASEVAADFFGAAVAMAALKAQ
jgi:hypothetical protein